MSDEALSAVIAVCSLKGGGGKTTTAISLAHELAEYGHLVELMDLDPQASATLALGEDPSPAPRDAGPIEVHGFRFWRAGRRMGFAGREEARRYVDRCDEDGLTLLDCPPALGPFVLAALERADLVLVPLEATPLALQGLADVESTLEALDQDPLVRALLVRLNTRRNLSGDVQSRMRKTRPEALYETNIPEDVRAAEAPGHGDPVGHYAPSSRSAAAYRNLADELLRDLRSL